MADGMSYLNRTSPNALNLNVENSLVNLEMEDGVAFVNVTLFSDKS